MTKNANQKSTPAKADQKKAETETMPSVSAAADKKSKVGPLMLKIVDKMTKSGPQTVANMAKDFSATEREVRQAIDRARAKKHKILRLEKNTFGFSPSK